MVYAKSEITPNDALKQSTAQEREATLARLREGDSKIDPAVRTQSGCLVCQKTGTRTGGGPTSYPATPIKKAERAERGKNGTHMPRPPPILINRLIAYHYGNDAAKHLLVNGDGQASHLCSTAQCMEPRHIIVESKATNEARKCCPLRHEKVYVRKKSGKRSKPNDLCSCHPLCIRKTEIIVFSSDEE